MILLFYIDLWDTDVKKKLHADILVPNLYGQFSVIFPGHVDLNTEDVCIF